MMLEQKMKGENAIEYSAWKIMDIKVLKATKLSFESTTIQFSDAMRIGAVKWKPNFLKWGLATLYTSAYFFQIAREKSCDYVLIIDMKKFEIAYHN